MNKLLIFTLLSVTFLPSTYAGNESGGLDYVSWDDGAAWFVGNHKSISYCVEQGANFPLSKKVTILEIEAAMSTWTEYVKKTASTDSLLHYRYNNNVDKRFLYPTTKGKFTKTCDSADIVFYLDKLPPQNLAKKYKDKLDHAMAASVRTEFDISKGWGKGFIWLRGDKQRWGPYNYKYDWSAPFTFRGAMIHELGHVFGTGHIPNTVMSATFWYNLENKVISRNQYYFTRIDMRRELAPCISCNFAYKGIFGKFSYLWLDLQTKLAVAKNNEAEVFQKLTGRLIKGDTASSITGVADWPSIKNLRLTISDALSTYIFPIVVNDPSAHDTVIHRQDYDRVMKVSIKKGKKLYWNELTSHSAVFYGVILASGKPYPVSIERNLNLDPLLIRVFINGKWLFLFQAFPNGFNPPMS